MKKYSHRLRLGLSVVFKLAFMVRQVPVMAILSR
jgi:hypothetical protein